MLILLEVVDEIGPARVPHLELLLFGCSLPSSLAPKNIPLLPLTTEISNRYFLAPSYLKTGLFGLSFIHLFVFI